VSGDYIGGVALTPDGACVVAAAGDGVVSLLEARKGGATLASALCGAPLRCCCTDGSTAVVGAEDGRARPLLSP
jgi:hypothetical protein